MRLTGRIRALEQRTRHDDRLAKLLLATLAEKLAETIFALPVADQDRLAEVPERQVVKLGLIEPRDVK